MCGRYGLFPPPEEIARLFGVSADFEYSPRFNIAPSQRALIAVGSSAGPRLGPLRWGFEVGNAPKARRMINARSETAHSSPAFRTAFARRRCVVPASGFYEWRPEEEGKVPYWVHSPSDGLILMAGIWGRDTEIEGGEQRQTGEAGYAVLTRPATRQMSRIHHRMPVLLSTTQAELWLDKQAAVETVREAMMGDPVELSAHAVSTAMNRAANDAPECIRPTHDSLF